MYICIYNRYMWANKICNQENSISVTICTHYLRAFIIDVDDDARSSKRVLGSARKQWRALSVWKHYLTIKCWLKADWRSAAATAVCRLTFDGGLWRRRDGDPVLGARFGTCTHFRSYIYIYIPIFIWIPAMHFLGFGVKNGLLIATIINEWMNGKAKKR